MADIKLELDQKKHGAFNLYENGSKIGEMVVSIANETLTVYHTEVGEEFAGKGYAKQLLDKMTAYVREHKYTVRPLCPYVFAQFKRYPSEYEDIWKKE